MNISKEELKNLGLTLGAFAASILLKKLLEEGYKSVYKEEPPNAVKDDELNWGKVVGWSIVSGVAAASLKVLVKRLGAQKLEA